MSVSICESTALYLPSVHPIIRHVAAMTAMTIDFCISVRLLHSGD